MNGLKFSNFEIANYVRVQKAS